MEGFINEINNYVPYIVIAMTIIIVLLFTIVIILFKSVGNLENRYRRLMRGTNGKNIEAILNTKLDEIEESNKNCKSTVNEVNRIKEEMKNCTQKVSMIRYKAFEDVGSDLSFSIALLDGNNDGIMITGIYSRQESTTYAKPIDKGISRYDLSQEEVHVLNEAMNKK